MPEVIIPTDAHSYIKDKYGSFGRYVNTSRHITNIMDGLKPSYRKTIFSAMEVAKDKMAKTINIAANTVNRYSVHGDASIVPIVSNLVNAGIFNGQGNHGGLFLTGLKADPAAPRYTEAMMNPYYQELFSKLLGFVPRSENEHGNMEPDYIPTPIPLSLVFGSLGIGFGTGQSMPAFTPKSMLNAYLNDNPELLESSYGIEITNKDSLLSLWNTGKGFVHYKYKVYRSTDNRKVYLEGTPMIIPNISGLKSYESQGRVQILDESADIQKLSFQKIGAVRFPTIDEIYELVNKSSIFSKAYYIRVNVNGVIRQIGLKSWIDITYKNYKKLMQEYISKSIKDLEYSILIYSNFRKVADLIINHKDLTYQQIADQVGITIDVVNNISGKTLHMLRTFNPESKIEKCKSDIQTLSSLNIDQYIKDTINAM